MRLILFLIVLALAGIACGSAAALPTKTPDEYAWYGCTLFVEQQLGLSMGDAQRYNAAGVTSLGGGQYRIRVYYAKTNAAYACQMAVLPNGDTQLFSLDRVP